MPRLMQLSMTTRPLRCRQMVNRMMQLQVSAPSSSDSSGSRRGLQITGLGTFRTFVSVGDKVPVNFIKGNLIETNVNKRNGTTAMF